MTAALWMQRREPHNKQESVFMLIQMFRVIQNDFLSIFSLGADCFQINWKENNGNATNVAEVWSQKAVCEEEMREELKFLREP